MKKQSVLITGASRGIGRAIAEAFHGAGYRVAIGCGAHVSEAESLAESLSRAGGEAIMAPFDLTSEAAVADGVKRVVNAFGGLDVLVNNAGVALPQMVLQDCSAAEFDHVFNVNIRGMFLVTRAALPTMISQKNGAVVNVSSMWGVTGGSCETPYSASKAAVIGFTKALAKEVAPSLVRVNCVAPGFVPTDMNAALSPETIENIREETPLLSLGTPQDIASAVLFFASSGARFITGQTLCVDGGRCI